MAKNKDSKKKKQGKERSAPIQGNPKLNGPNEPAT